MKKIIISRTDSIGDVMLTLPMLVWLKKNYPEAELIYLGSGYTKPVVDCFSVVDQFLDWKEIENLPTAERVSVFREIEADAIIHVFPVKEIATLAKKAKIPMRVGTSHRSFHLLTCNHRLNFTRQRSELHESQLNFELLRPFGLKELPSLTEVTEMTNAFQVRVDQLPLTIASFVANCAKRVILHPKSQGSAIEWPIEKYMELADKLVEQGYCVCFTGTEKEGLLFRDKLSSNDQILDTTGKMSLEQLIGFIKNSDALVACSTGPLHIAGFTGIKTIGLFSPKKPIHPGRWGALGPDTHMLVFDANCPTCKKKKECNCISEISVEAVLQMITN
jgi:heptosyltransferase III